MKFKKTKLAHVRTKRDGNQIKLEFHAIRIKTEADAMGKKASIEQKYAVTG